MRRARFHTKNEHVPHPGTHFPGALVALVLSCVPTGAEPFTWVPSPSHPANHVSEDLELSLRARKILLHDEGLAGQLLGISVRNRIATLWGTVASARAARQAEECLRSLPGLASVRNDLTIDPRAERREDQTTLPYLPSRTLSSRPPVPDARRVPGTLVYRADEREPMPSESFLWRPARRGQSESLPKSADRVAEPGKVPAKPVRESLPGFPSGDSTRIPSQSATSTLPLRRQRAEEPTPEIPPMLLSPAPSPVDSARATLPSPPAGLPATSNLEQAIETLRLVDDRFRGIRVQVRGDTVYLRGTVFRWEHLFELARSVSRVPGVRHVLFEEVRAEIAP